MAPSPSSLSRSVTWIVAGMLLGLGGLEAAHWVARTGSALAFGFELDYGEGPLLTQVQRLGRGESLFLPLGEGRWVVTNYPLVYHSAVLALQGLGLELLPAARAVTALATLGVAGSLLALVLLATRRREGEPDRGPRAVGGLLAALLFLGVDSVWTWSGVARVDMLALFWAASGLMVFSKRGFRPWGWWPAIPLFALAFYTKQSTVAAAAAAFGVLVLRHPRQALAFAACLGATLASVGLFAVWTTDGGFWFHAVTANNNAYLWSRTSEYLTALARGNELLLLLGVGAAASRLLIRGQEGGEVRDLMGMWVLTAFLVGLTVGKIGSNINYLVEFVTAVCAMSGLAVADALGRLGLRRVGLACIPLALAGLHLARESHLDFTRDGIRPHRQEGLPEVLAALRQAPGQVLAEDMTLLALADRELVFQPFIMTQLAEQDLWDPAPFLERLGAAHYSLIALKQEAREDLAGERFSGEMLAAIEAAYVCTSRHGRFLLYEPR